MPSNCAVAICKTDKRLDHQSMISMFTFPRDPELQHIWISRCQRSKPINVKYARVCSLHFAPEDFERDIKSEILGLPPRRLLKRGAVPTLLLESSPMETEEEYRDQTLSNLQEYVSGVKASSLVENISAVPVVATISDNQIVELRSANRLLKEQLEQKDQTIARLKLLEERVLERDQTIANLKRRVNALKMQVSSKSKATNEAKKKLVNYEKLLSPAQIDLITKKKKSVRWSETDISKAVRGMLKIV